MSLWLAVALLALTATGVLACDRGGGGRVAATVTTLAAMLTAAWIAVDAGAIATLALRVVGAVADPAVRITAAGVPFREQELLHWFDTGEVRSLLSLRLDPLSATCTLVVLLAGAVLLAQSGSRARRNGATLAGQAGLLLAAVTLLVLAADLLLLVAAWQLVSVVVYASLTRHGRDAAPVARTALTSLRVGNAALLLAVLAIAWELGTLRMGDIAERSVIAWLPGQPVAIVVALLLLVAAVALAAAVPLHLWLVGTGRTRWITMAVPLVVLPVAGLYLLGRFHVILMLGSAALSLAAGLGVVGALSAAVAATAQRRPRSVLIYGLVAHTGVSLAAIGVGAFAVGVTHAVAGALAATLLLALDDLTRCGGATEPNPADVPAKHQPHVLAVALLGVAAWAGLPLISPVAAARESVAWSALRPPIGALSLWVALVMTLAALAFAAVRWLCVAGIGTIRIGGRRELVPAAFMLAMLVLLGSAGVARGGASNGLLAGFVDAALPVPPRLANMAVDEAVWLTPQAAAGVRRYLEWVIVAAAGAGAALGWLLYRGRPGLRAAAARSPLLATLRRAAASGWYADDLIEVLIRRPFLATGFLLRARRGPDAAVQRRDAPWCRRSAAAVAVAATLPVVVFLLPSGTSGAAIVFWLPLVSAGVAALVAAISSRLTLWVGLTGCAVQLGLVAGFLRDVVALSGAAPAEPLALLFTAGIAATGLLALLAVPVEANGWRGAPALLLGSMAALQVAILGDSLLLILVGWAAAVATLWLQSGGADTDGPARRALIIAVAGVVCLALATLLVGRGGFGPGGSLAAPLAQVTGDAEAAASNSAAVLFLLGFVLLAGLFPLHSWRLRFVAAAPVGAAVLVSTSWVLAATYGLIRIVPVAFPGYWASVGTPLAFLGVASVLFAVFAILGQRDLLGVIGHIGLMHGGIALLGFAAWGFESIQGGVTLLFTSAFASAGLWLLAVVLAGHGERLEFAAMSGTWGRRPVMTAIASVLVLAAGAVAGSGLFVGSVLVLLGSFRVFPGLVAVASIGSVLSTVAIAHAHHRVIFGRADGTDGVEGARRRPATGASAGERVALMLPIALVLAVGGAPGPFLGAAGAGIAQLLATEVPFRPADPEIGRDGRRVAAAPAPSAEQVAQKEEQVGWPLRQPAHEPGVPARSVAHVDTDAIAVAH